MSPACIWVSDREGAARAADSATKATIGSREVLAPFVFPLLLFVCAAFPFQPLSAQAVLTGTVVSAEGGEPVEGAAVTLETWDGSPVAEVRSDAEGRFRIEADRAQAYVVSAAARAFSRSELELVELEEGEVTEVTLTVTPQERPEARPRFDPVEAAPGEIAGRVVDAGTGTPVPGAAVVLLARRGEERIQTVTSGPEGVFRLTVPEVGVYRLFAEVGTFARSETLLVDGATTRGLSLTVELVSDPIQLDEITAEGREEIYWWQDQKPMEVWTYYERRYFYDRLNMGRFYDGQYLEDWAHVSAFEFLLAHTFPAARSAATAATAREQACARVGVFLDGHIVGVYHMGLEGLPRREQSAGAAEQNFLVTEQIAGLRAEDLEGVEIYREGAFNPADLRDAPRHPPYCEVIAFWRKRDPGSP